MFTNHSSTETATIPEASCTPQNEQSARLAERLREIAGRHQVCYEVWPEWSSLEGRKIQIGFELQLCGINTHSKADGPNHPVPGCAQCFCTYNELRQIADWILPQEERPSRYEIGAFDHALHIAPKERKSRNEVVVRIHIMHRRDFNRDVDDCENRCLREMREKLVQLGVKDGIWDGENHKDGQPGELRSLGAAGKRPLGI